MSVQIAEIEEVYRERPHLTVIIGGQVPDDAPIPEDPIAGKPQLNWYTKVTDEETAAKLADMDPAQQTKVAAGVVHVLRKLPELRTSTPEQQEKRIETIASFLGGMTCSEIARIDGRSASAVLTSVNGIGERIVKQVPEDARLQMIDNPGEISFTPLVKTPPRKRQRREEQSDHMQREIVLSPDNEMNEESIKRMLSHRILRPSEELDLSKRVEKGDLTAKDALITHNMRLVVSIARKYQNISSEFKMPDLIQEGSLGLIRASEKFDWRKGYRFSTYATLWIRQAIQRGLADKGRMIRLPVHVNEKHRKLTKAAKEMGLQLEGSQESLEMLSDSTKIPLEDILLIQRATFKPVSLDKPVGDEEDTTFGSLQDSGVDIVDEVHENLLNDLLYEKLDELKEQDSESVQILQLHFGLETGESLSEKQIGKKLGITELKVKRKLSTVLDLLYEKMKDPEPVMV